jgi:hypothetical protein
MSVFKGALVALALAAATAASTTPSFAQMHDQAMAEGTVLMVSPAGRYVMGKMTDKTKAMLGTATPVSGGTMIIMSGGKLYVLPDPGGTMYGKMSDYVGAF